MTRKKIFLFGKWPCPKIQKIFILNIQIVVFFKDEATLIKQNLLPTLWRQNHLSTWNIVHSCFKDCYGMKKSYKAFHQIYDAILN